MGTHARTKRRKKRRKEKRGGIYFSIQGPRDGVANRNVTQKEVRGWEWHDMLCHERETVTRDSSMGVFAEGFLLRLRRDQAGKDS